MTSVELNLKTFFPTSGDDKAIAALTQTVKEIASDISWDKTRNYSTPMEQYLDKFTITTPLSNCNERTQKLYQYIVTAVKKKLSENPVYKLAVEKPNEAPCFLHFALQPTKDLIAKLDEEQPAAVNKMTRPPKQEGPRVSLKDLQLLEGTRFTKGLLPISNERLNDLRLDRDDLLKLDRSEKQERMLRRLNDFILKCEAHAK